MSQLFQSILWPAIAGNVAWAFLSVLILEWGKDVDSYRPRLALLAAMAIYLCLDWTHTEAIKGTLRKRYWVADIFLAMSIAAVAIAAQATFGEGRWFLTTVFAVSCVSQLFGAWTPSNQCAYRKGGWKTRVAWFALNALAAAIAICGATSSAWGWNLFLAAGVVIACWGFAKPGQSSYLAWLREQGETC